jgi:hypothetical protein
MRLGEALAWPWHRRGLREVYGVLTALNLLGGAFMIPLIVLVGERGGGALGTGTVLAGAGIGGLVAALGSTLIGRLLPVGAMMITIVAVFGAAVAAMALPFGPWWPMVPLIVITGAATSAELRRFTGEDSTDGADSSTEADSAAAGSRGPSE